MGLAVALAGSLIAMPDAAAARTQVGQLTDPAYVERRDEVLATGAPEAVLALAEAAIDAGRYEQAVGVLSGLVLRDPGNIRLKLLLGDLYTRMGSYAQAQIYLDEALRSGALTANQRQLALTLKAVGEGAGAAPARDGFTYNGRVSTGLRYRSNATGGTTSDSLIINDQVIAARPASEAEGDFDWFFTGFARFEAPVADDVAVDGRATLFSRKQFSETESDLVVFEAAPGLIWTVVRDAEFAMAARTYAVGGVSLSQEDPALSYGGAGVEFRQRVGREWLFRQVYEHRRQNYHNTDTAPSLDRLDGYENRFGAGAVYRPTPELSFSVGYAANLRETGRDFLDRTRHRVTGAATLDYPTPFGHTDQLSTLRLSLSGVFDRFGGADPAISATTERSDDTFAINVSNSFALTDHLSLDFGAGHSRRGSNLPNFETRNHQGAVGVSVRF